MSAVFSSGPNAGQPNPLAGGVYNNTVENNTSNGNGAKGIGLFNFAYNNTIEGNSTSNKEVLGSRSTRPSKEPTSAATPSREHRRRELAAGRSRRQLPGPAHHPLHPDRGHHGHAKVTPVTGTVI